MGVKDILNKVPTAGVSIDFSLVPPILFGCTLFAAECDLTNFFLGGYLCSR
jgi:hypothetical protein